jgi:hypothetical protein
MALSFTIAADFRQRSHSQVRAPRDSWPHFTVTDSRLPNLECQVPVFISRRKRVTQLYPRHRVPFTLSPTSDLNAILFSCIAYPYPKKRFSVTQRRDGFQERVHHSARWWLARIHLHGKAFADSFPSNGSTCTYLHWTARRCIPGHVTTTVRTSAPT